MQNNLRIMSTQKSYTIKNTLYLVGMLAVLFFGSVSSAAAAAIFSSGGGGDTTAVSGELVTLYWYIDDPSISNCVINNGVGEVDLSVLPAEKTIEVTPPPGAEATYTMTCNGFASSVTVATEPIVTLTLRDGSPRTTDPVTGVISSVYVDWSSQYATECSDVWRTSASYPDGKTAYRSEDYSNKNRPAGWVKYSGWPHDSISETTTFYIECTNSTTGTSKTESVTLTVLEPSPPPSPVIDVWTTTPLVFTDPLYGYADARIRFEADYVQKCAYKAFYEDGTEYTRINSDGEVVPTLPVGFGQWDGKHDGDFTARIVETTTFQVTCWRDDRIIGGELVAGEEVSGSVLVTVGGGDVDLDRTTLAPVTISVTAEPNPTMKDNMTGEAPVTATVVTGNADYCYSWAENVMGNDYYVSGWTRTKSYKRISGNGTSTYSFTIPTDTNLVVECRRVYDVVNYPPGSVEYSLGYEKLLFLVNTTEADISAPAPVVYMYGGGVKITAEEMFTTAIANTNFFLADSNHRIEASNAGPAYSSISFPYNDPSGGADGLDVILTFCDETDGVDNVFTVSTDANGVLGSITSDDPTALDNDCNSKTERSVVIDSGVTMSDGDIVKIECQQDFSTGERCRLIDVQFATGNTSSVAAAIDPDTGLAEATITWFTDNATQCNPQDDDALVVGSGATYRWYYGNQTSGSVTQYIATSTKFSLECSRTYDGATADSYVTFNTPQETSFELSIDFSFGDCLDTVADIDKDFIIVDDVIIDAGKFGYMRDDSTPYCIPAIDLAAGAPSANTPTDTNVNSASDGVDNVNGTYDLEIIAFMYNRGPGELPVGEEVSYQSVLDLEDVWGMNDIKPNPEVDRYSLGAPTASQLPLGEPIDKDIGIESDFLEQDIDNVPFGTHLITTTVNAEEPIVPEHDAFAPVWPNFASTQIYLPVPQPPMTLTASPRVIRGEQVVDITWDVNVTYELWCELQGPGGVSAAEVDASGVGEQTITSGFLSSTSKFVLTCEERRVTGGGDDSTFIQEVVVEVIPDLQET